MLSLWLTPILLPVSHHYLLLTADMHEPPPCECALSLSLLLVRVSARVPLLATPPQSGITSRVRAPGFLGQRASRCQIVHGAPPEQPTAPCPPSPRAHLHAPRCVTKHLGEDGRMTWMWRDVRISTTSRDSLNTFFGDLLGLHFILKRKEEEEGIFFWTERKERKKGELRVERLGARGTRKVADHAYGNFRFRLNKVLLKITKFILSAGNQP